MAHDIDASATGEHPDTDQLESFMRNEAEPAERRWIVRHLIAGCPRCLAVTSELWALGDPPAGARRRAARSEAARQRSGEHRSDSAAAETYDAIFERLAAAGERVEEEREQAPRLAAELLAMPPAARAAAAGRRFTTPPVCQLLLERSREAAAGDPRLAAQAAVLAPARGERLDEAACGAAVGRGLRARAWGHLGHARRLGGDLEGAEWALALAEALAAGEGGDPGWPGEMSEAGEAEEAAVPRRVEAGRSESAAGLEPAEWAELLVFKAGLRADRGELGAADRLLGRAARLFRSAGEAHRAGVALAEQGSIRAELGDLGRAAELLRAGIDLLDLAAAPRLVAATLCRLAALLGGAWPATPAASPGGPASPAAAQAAPAGHAAAQAGSAAAPAGHAAGAPSGHRGAEALHLLGRARALYRGLGDAAAEARLSRLQGQVEAALGRLDEAEATLRTAFAALTRHGLGREASRALVELALVLVRLGRGREVRALGLERRAMLSARDKSWRWFSGVLVFQMAADRHGAGADAEDHVDVDGKLVSELARYLANPQLAVATQGEGRFAAPRLTRVA